MSTRAESAPPRRSLLDLGPRARVVFAVLYVGAMASVIVSAQYRPDHVFGFQMLNESSTLEIHLAREVRRRRDEVPVVAGQWQARDRNGKLGTFRWDDRVKDSVLEVLDAPVHAKYGLSGPLFHLQLALEDVLNPMPEDSETTGLIAHVTTVLNCRAPAMVRLHSKR